MRVERPKPRSRAIENPTLEALPPGELEESVPAAERWIFGEVKKMQDLDQRADVHRRRAMAGIAERFHQRLDRYCATKLGPYRPEAEDVVQEVFQELEKLLSKIQDESHLRNLIFRLARTRCADVVARHRRMVYTGEELEATAAANEPTDEFGADPELLRAAIRSLPRQEDRILLMLSIDHRMSVKQVAAVLGISEGACKMRRHRARQKLKELLVGEGERDDDSD